jgi:hypothetical protein
MHHARRLFNGFSLAAAALALVCALAREAGAVELRDGNDFWMQIDDASARACVRWPAGMRDPVACAGLPDEKPALADGPNVVAVVVLRGNAPRPDGDLDVGVLCLTHIPVKGIAPFDGAGAHEFGQAYVKAADKLEPPAHIDQSSVESVLVKLGKLTLVRLTYDITGFAPDDAVGSVSHQRVFVAAVQDGEYVAQWMTSAKGAAAFDPIADVSSRTIVVGHPATGGVDWKKALPIAAPSLLGIAIVGVIAALRARGAL